MQTSVSDTGQVKEQKQKEQNLRKTEIEDVKSILSTEHGRRFFFRYLTICGVFKSSFTGSSETYFLEGRRDIGLRLLSDINESNPRAYAALMEENERVLK